MGKGKCKGKYDIDGYHAALDEWIKMDGEFLARARAEQIMASDPEIAKKIGIALRWCLTPCRRKARGARTTRSTRSEMGG